MTQLNGGLGQLGDQMSLFFRRRFALVRGKRMAVTSRMNREVHVRCCERPEVKFLRPTRRFKRSEAIVVRDLNAGNPPLF
jgi:hypothetical protein